MGNAILYARVSTLEQAQKGYSLAQQIGALRQYAESNGYRVLEEVKDQGQSGADLERPGLDRVRDLVAAGGVDLVLAQDLDRISREPWHYEYLKDLFEDYGTQLHALDVGDDDSPMGEFVGYVRRGVAKLERADITRRTQRGRRQRVREGKIIAAGVVPYGFAYNEDRSNFIPDTGQLAVVRDIFEMAARGASLHKIKKTLEADGKPAPKGGKLWHRAVIRDIILNDLYRPHSFKELEGLTADGLMSADVLSRLAPDASYGVWYYNQEAVRRTRSGNAKRKSKTKPRSEWMAVPTPDPGIPPEWVDAARAAIQDNVRTSNAGKRFWELSGGIVFCPCGYRLGTHTKVTPTKTFYYYVCRRRQQHGPAACEHARFHRAERTEEQVRQFALNLIRKPETLRKQVEAEAERLKGSTRNLERETLAWTEQLAKVQRKRAGYQDQQAEGLMTIDELRIHLTELGEQKAQIEKELDRLRSIRQDRDYLDDLPGLVEDYLRDLPQLTAHPVRKQADAGGEDSLRIYTVTRETAQPRPEIDQEASARKYRDLYDDLQLKATAHKDGTLDITWGFRGWTASATR